MNASIQTKENLHLQSKFLKKENTSLRENIPKKILFYRCRQTNQIQICRCFVQTVFSSQYFLNARRGVHVRNITSCEPRWV